MPLISSGHLGTPGCGGTPWSFGGISGKKLSMFLSELREKKCNVSKKKAGDGGTNSNYCLSFSKLLTSLINWEMKVCSL
jgi:hypothetical protein